MTHKRRLLLWASLKNEYFLSAWMWLVFWGEHTWNVNNPGRRELRKSVGGFLSDWGLTEWSPSPHSIVCGPRESKHWAQVISAFKQTTEINWAIFQSWQIYLFSHWSLSHSFPIPPSALIYFLPLDTFHGLLARLPSLLQICIRPSILLLLSLSRSLITNENSLQEIACKLNVCETYAELQKLGSEWSEGESRREREKSSEKCLPLAFSKTHYASLLFHSAFFLSFSSESIRSWQQHEAACNLDPKSYFHIST